MSRGTTTDMDTVDEILRMSGGGMSVPQIHEETGVPVPTIYRLIRESTIRDDNGAELSPSAQAEIIEGYLAHKPLEPLVQAHRTSLTAAFALLRKAGIDVRTRSTKGDTVAARRDNAVRLYVENAGVLDILQATGISSTSLYKELRKRGIALRNNYAR